MIGLTPQNDPRLSSNKRTYKFAERLSGRFFVAGVSGSFQKHRKHVLSLDKEGNVVKTEKYTYQPLLEKHQQDALRAEAEALLRMEEKLAEIKRNKEMRKRRDEARQKGRIEYKAARLIQSVFRRYLRRKFTAATTIVKSFLRVTANKQALTTAVWAAATIRRFSTHVTGRFKMLYEERQAARAAAVNSWDIISQVASVWVSARRQVADDFVHNSLTTALNSRVNVLKLQRQQQKPVRGTLLRRSSTKQQGVLKGANFFLTEWDANGTDDADDINDCDEGDDYGSLTSRGSKGGGARCRNNINNNKRMSRSVSTVTVGNNNSSNISSNTSGGRVSANPARSASMMARTTSETTFSEKRGLPTRSLLGGGGERDNDRRNAAGVAGVIGIGAHKPRHRNNRDRDRSSDRDYSPPVARPISPVPRVGRIYDPAEESARRVIALHKAKVAEMEAEQQRRLQMVEDARKQQLAAAQALEASDGREKEDRLSMKARFVARLEEVRKQALVVSALREAEKAGKLRREATSEEGEGEGESGATGQNHREPKPSKPAPPPIDPAIATAMAAAALRVKAAAKESKSKVVETQHVAAKVKPYVPLLTEEQRAAAAVAKARREAQLAEEARAIEELRIKHSEESALRVAKGREALKRRLQLKEEHRKRQSQQEAEDAVEKKGKLDQLAMEAQMKLQKALALKQAKKDKTAAAAERKKKRKGGGGKSGGLQIASDFEQECVAVEAGDEGVDRADNEDNDDDDEDGEEDNGEEDNDDDDNSRHLLENFAPDLMSLPPPAVNDVNDDNYISGNDHTQVKNFDHKEVTDNGDDHHHQDNYAKYRNLVEQYNIITAGKVSSPPQSPQQQQQQQSPPQSSGHQRSSIATPAVTEDEEPTATTTTVMFSSTPDIIRPSDTTHDALTPPGVFEDSRRHEHPPPQQQQPPPGDTRYRYGTPPDSAELRREELHCISSARETAGELLDDFGVDDFFSGNNNLTCLYSASPTATPTATDITTAAEDGIGSEREWAKLKQQTAAKRAAHKSNPLGKSTIPAGKHQQQHKQQQQQQLSNAIPQSLQATPYFAHYKKHSNTNNGSGSQMYPSKSKVKITTKSTADDPSDKQQKVDKSHGHSGHGHGHGHVSSLLAMVERARAKLGEDHGDTAVMLDPMESGGGERNNAHVHGTALSGHCHQHQQQQHSSHITAPSPSSLHTGHQHQTPQPHPQFQQPPLSVPMPMSMTFKKFASMSPNIPLPPLNNNSNGGTGAAGTPGMVGSSGLPSHSTGRAGFSNNSTATNSSIKPKAKKVKSGASRARRVEEEVRRERDRAEDEEERALQQEYEARRDEFNKKLLGGGASPSSSSSSASLSQRQKLQPQAVGYGGGGGRGKQWPAHESNVDTASIGIAAAAAAAADDDDGEDIPYRKRNDHTGNNNGGNHADDDEDTDAVDAYDDAQLLYDEVRKSSVRELLGILNSAANTAERQERETMGEGEGDKGGGGGDSGLNGRRFSSREEQDEDQEEEGRPLQRKPADDNSFDNNQAAEQRQHTTPSLPSSASASASARMIGQASLLDSHNNSNNNTAEERVGEEEEGDLDDDACSALLRSLATKLSHNSG